MIESFFMTFGQLLFGHALADFSLQHDPMAKGKNRHAVIDLSRIPPGQKIQAVWLYWLSAHALIHGGVVAYMTESYGLGAAETLAHWIIDFGKCENKYGIHTDQALHILCKVAWVLIYLKIH